MKTVTYRKVEYNQVRGSSCDKCYFFQLEPSDRPCGKRPLDKNFPECLGVFREDKTDVVFRRVPPVLPKKRPDEKKVESNEIHQVREVA